MFGEINRDLRGRIFIVSKFGRNNIFMKSVCLLSFFIFCINSLYSQVDSISKANLENIVRSINTKGTIVYTDRIDPGVLKRQIKSLYKTKITGISSDTDSNSITLTKKERIYLLNELKKCTRPYWKDSVFKKSKRIKLDSAAMFTANKQKEVFSFINNPKATDSLKKIDYGFYWECAVFEFSDIIYLRNRSIFLNFCMWYDGHGGAVDLYFYKLKNGIWKKWILVSGGDW